MINRFRHLFDDKPPASKPKEKPCDFPGCLEEAHYRAPRSRELVDSAHAHDWHWFCLTHVRQYNATWNYYANMSGQDVENDIRSNQTWQRPSWPIGHWTARTRHWQECLDDPMGIFNEPKQTFTPSLASTLRQAESLALVTLKIGYPFTSQQLKDAYHTQAKRHHPDANGGCPKATDKIKEINQAYQMLKPLAIKKS